MGAIGIELDSAQQDDPAGLRAARAGADPRPAAANADVLADRHDDGRVPEPPGRAAIEAALDRVLASEVFRHSRRHREFLEYLVGASLDGRARRLKEVAIGLDVFGRAIDGYDPGRDSIVRVEARRLRNKLDRYYRVDGAGDAIRIRVPVGSYVPVFDVRTPDERMRPAPLLMVMPFVAPGADPRNVAIAAGLSDLVIERLGDASGWRVVAPIEAQSLQAQAIGIEALRNRHGIDCVVDGGVVGDGSRLRCVVHLSLTRERTRAWSKAFLFDAAAADDLFAFQDRVADAVVAAVVARKDEA